MTKKEEKRRLTNEQNSSLLLLSVIYRYSGEKQENQWTDDHEQSDDVY